ncbi:hypothetical protein KPH14_003918 [Odynerus spinipes]|uniref:Elongator complex protein 5 n=1 Tax=Odynerus spinipes TaxID=1348599 RepID=A0AAD9RXL2_9HYME|nr:hypothetical protein KPH14_003918 [Odynerus spinipes]
MIQLKTLPLLNRISTTIVEEDISAPYGKILIAGWLQTWKEMEPNCTIDLLSFSNPKSWYLNGPKPYTLDNVKISDYYTVEVDKPQENFVNTLQHILDKVTKKSVIFIDNLDSLILYVGLAYSLWFIEMLSRKVERLVCLFRRDCIQNKLSCIETFGNTYVKLHNYSGMHSNNEYAYIANYTHRKPGGTITRGSELVKQDIKTYEIKSENLKTQLNSEKNSTPANDAPKIVSSFRIEINEHEMKQRENTPLPYTLTTNVTSNTSKILYVPDEVDDLDEEDPDDDLCI